MPKCNKILALAAISALFAVPAFADGTPGKQVNRGPAPLQAHAPTPPEPGCYLIDNGRAWSCPPLKAHTPKRTAQTTTHVRRSAPTVTRTTHTRTVPGTVTRRHTTGPVRRTQTHTTRTVAAPQGLTLDMAAFTGGVGNGVDGGYYGGGGGIVISGGRSYSGVLSHSASSFTFRQRSHGRRGGKKRGGGGGGCGCN